jgi:hypothetical protein
VRINGVLRSSRERTEAEGVQLAEKKDEKKGFKVEDKRTSRKGAGQDETAAVEEAGIPDDGGKGAGEVEGTTSGKDDGGAGPSPGSEIPRVDFSTFVFSLFHSALIQLGEMSDPVSGEESRNLDAAKQTIDILNIIQEKTEGNLTDEEKKFLENATAELKWKFLNAVKEKGK